MRRYLDGHSHVPMRIEIRMKKLNSKSWSWVRVNGLARRDKQRRPVMLVGVWVNITRRKTAELRAAEDRDLFHTLIEHIPDSIYFKNRESRFVLANTATANKLGVPTPADLTGRTDDYFLTKRCPIFPARRKWTSWLPDAPSAPAFIMRHGSTRMIPGARSASSRGTDATES